MRGIMIQGTASDVGKSLIQTVLCRLFVNSGYRVAPFKSQNMSNNIYMTKANKEISTAQALQAEAAKTEPIVAMNPIVLKPTSDLRAEVIMLGESVELMSGKLFRDTFYERGLQVINDSLHTLAEHFDIIVLEGAGSPVEINLKEKELVNMKVAEIADVPVLLVADIDRGGVFASIVGTLALLTPPERKRVKGIIINKFRGDLSLFSDGVEWIEHNTGIPVLGVIPFVNHGLEPEDSLSEQTTKQMNRSSSTDVDIYDELANKVKEHLDFAAIKRIINEWNSV